MALGKENIEPADFVKLGGEVVLQDGRNGLPQYRCRVCPRFSARRWSKSLFQRHLSSGAHHKNLQLATTFSDDRAASPSTLPSSPYRMVTPVSARGSSGFDIPPSVRPSLTRSDPGSISSPALIADLDRIVDDPASDSGDPQQDHGETLSRHSTSQGSDDDSRRLSTGSASEGWGGLESDFDFSDAWDADGLKRLDASAGPLNRVGLSRKAKSTPVPSPDSPYFPFPSHEMLVAALHLRSPSKRVGMAQYQSTRSVVKALGLGQMPAAKTVAKFLENLAKEVPLFVPRPATTYKGHTIDVISPADMIRSHFAISELRELMAHVPTLRPTSIKSAADTRAFWELSPDARTPMQRFAAFDVFIGEIVMLVRGQLVYVTSFIQDGAQVKIVVARARISDGDDDNDRLIHVDLPLSTTEPTEWVSGDVMEDATAYLVGPSLIERLVHAHVRFTHIKIHVPARPRSSLDADSTTDAENAGEPYPVADDSLIYKKPLPLVSQCRNIAKGRRWFVVPVRLFLDDLSGGVSKRQFPLYVLSVQRLALPSEVLHRQAFLHMACASAKAGALEIAQDVLRQVAESLTNPLTAFDASCGEEVLFSMPCLYSVHDTPMAAEVTARATGGQAKFPCRFGMWGGSLAQRLELLALKHLFSCPDRHSRLRTIAQSTQAISFYVEGLGQTKLDDHMRDTGTRDKVTLDVIERLEHAYQAEQRYWAPDDAPPEQISAEARAYRAMAPKQQAHVRQESDERGRMAVEALIVQMEDADEPMHGPFFDVPDYDPHLATPPDLLHILLLGMVKYLWVSTTKKRSADEKQELISWLATQSSCGLGEQIKGEFYVRASASCVGKDFRVIAQIPPLVAYFLQQRMWLSQSEAECWMALGKLTRNAMRTDTDDLAAYADTYKVLATRFVQLSLQRNASHVVSKVKYHYLLHLEEAIRRFGLPRMFDSSVAESANKTVRDYCMHSNHHSPTCDIARQDSQAHRLVFIAAGGRWEGADGAKATAGPSVSQFFASQEGSDFRRELRLDDSKNPKVDNRHVHSGMALGNAKTALTTKEKIDATQACAALHHSLFGALGTTPSLRPGRFVTLRNGDHCWSRDWCFVQAGPQDQRPRVAQIVELWTVDGPEPEVIPPFGLSFVVLAFAAVGEELGDTGFLKMQRTGEIGVVPIEVLMALALVQHDCSGPCTLGEGARPIFAEGHYTGRIARDVVHDDDKNFLLSTINHRSYDIVDLFAPLLIPQQATDEFLEGLLQALKGVPQFGSDDNNDLDNNNNGQDSSRPAPRAESRQKPRLRRKRSRKASTGNEGSTTATRKGRVTTTLPAVPEEKSLGSVPVAEPSDVFGIGNQDTMTQSSFFSQQSSGRAFRLASLVSDGDDDEEEASLSNPRTNRSAPSSNQSRPRKKGRW